MTYEEFTNLNKDHFNDLVRLIDIKTKHRMKFTNEELEINEHLLEFQQQTKLNEWREKFEKCWEQDQ